MSIKIQLCYICTKQTKFYKLNAVCSWITLVIHFLYPVNRFYFWTKISFLNFIPSLLLYESFWQIWQVSDGKMLHSSRLPELSRLFNINFKDDEKTISFLIRCSTLPTFSITHCHRHEKRSKTSVTTFLVNGQFYVTAIMSGFSLKTPFKGFKRAFEWIICVI